jgi:hypothetical protein
MELGRRRKSSLWAGVRLSIIIRDDAKVRMLFVEIDLGAFRCSNNAAEI